MTQINCLSVQPCELKPRSSVVLERDDWLALGCETSGIRRSPGRPRLNLDFRLPTTNIELYNHPSTLIHIETMSALAKPASSLARSCARKQFPALCATTTAIQQRRNESATTSSFDSPFKGMGGNGTTKIPSFAKYRSSGTESSNKVFSYFMVGTFGAVTALGAKSMVQGE